MHFCFGPLFVLIGVLYTHDVLIHECKVYDIWVYLRIHSRFSAAFNLAWLQFCVFSFLLFDRKVVNNLGDLFENEVQHQWIVEAVFGIKHL